MKKDVKTGAKRFCLTIDDGRRQVIAGTLKPRRLLSRTVLTDSPAGCWLPAGTEPGRNGHNQGAALLAENWSYPLLAFVDCAAET